MNIWLYLESDSILNDAPSRQSSRLGKASTERGPHTEREGERGRATGRVTGRVTGRKGERQADRHTGKQSDPEVAQRPEVAQQQH